MIITVPFRLDVTSNPSVLNIARTAGTLKISNIDLRSITDIGPADVTIDSQYSNVTAPKIVGISYADNNHIALDASKCTSPVFATAQAMIDYILVGKDAAP